MPSKSNLPLDLQFQPLTMDRWPDFEALFGPQGAYGGCWCMWWRSTRREFEQRQGEGNRQAMKAIVESNEIPGILAYAEGEPVGWCSVAPREHYGSLERSPVLKRLDATVVWSLVCLFVAKGYRNRGVGEALIGGAVEYVRERGGKVVEGLPDPTEEGTPATCSELYGDTCDVRESGFCGVRQALEEQGHHAVFH